MTGGGGGGGGAGGMASGGDLRAIREAAVVGRCRLTLSHPS